MIEGSVGLCRSSVGEHRPLRCYYPGLAECYLAVWSEIAGSSDCF